MDINDIKNQAGSLPKSPEEIENLLLFEDFYEEYYAQAYRYALKKIGKPNDAEDLVSEVFLYCYEHFSMYDPAKAPIGAWLHIVLKSRLANYFRDHRKELSTDQIDLNWEPNEANSFNQIEKAIETMDLRDKLQLALSSLSPIQQQLVVLRYFHDCTTAQMALETGLTPGNVRTMLSRALDKIERYWNFHGWEL